MKNDKLIIKTIAGIFALLTSVFFFLMIEARDPISVTFCMFPIYLVLPLIVFL